MEALGHLIVNIIERFHWNLNNENVLHWINRLEHSRIHRAIDPIIAGKFL